MPSIKELSDKALNEFQKEISLNKWYLISKGFKVHTSEPIMVRPDCEIIFTNDSDHYKWQICDYDAYGVSRTPRKVVNLSAALRSVL